VSIALFVLRRLGRGVLTVWFAVTVTFLLLRLLPGDPALAVASTNMTEETRAALLTQYGLDKPLPTQYVLYLGQLLQGNLGTSFTQSVPVLDVLAGRIPWTLLLRSASRSACWPPPTRAG
jgi:peptide/nickel transport system permease protein